jgi:hypothetical protein
VVVYPGYQPPPPYFPPAPSAPRGPNPTLPTERR